MAEPIKAIFTDGLELGLIRCPACHGVRFQDYACDRCKALALKEALKQAQGLMAQLIEIFNRIENNVQ